MSRYLIESHIVQSNHLKQRISDYDTDHFISINSRTALKKAIKKGLVFLNNDIAYTSDYVKEGDTIEIFRDEALEIKTKIDLKLEVIYEDDYLVIINKPAGIVVSGNRHWSIQNALVNNVKSSSQKDALLRPEPAHRLDYPTSGALLIAKTSQTLISLNNMFKEKKINKLYHAITIGKMEESGSIGFNIDRKEAKTSYRVLETLPSPKYEYLNLLELKPHTGRKHQLRKHLAAIGHPIFGDLLYAKEGFILKGKGLFLHASHLSFIHPITHEELNISIPLPKKFNRLFGDYLCSGSTI